MRWSVAAVAALALLAGPIDAQAVSGGGITISPPLQQVAFSADSVLPVSVRITNNQTTPVTLNLALADVKSLNESGGVAFSGVGAGSSYGVYSLAHYATLAQPQVTLLPGQSTVVQAKLQPAQNVPVGGHYGAILVSQGGGGNGRNQVSLRQVAAALILAVRRGALNYNLQLQSIMNLPTHLLVPPASVRLRFHDSGNIQLTPRGTVTVTDPSGRQVSKGIIDTESGIILPGSYRQYTVAMQPLARAWLPGHYTVTVAYRYDGTEQLTSYTRGVWVASWLVLGVLVVLAAGVIAGAIMLGRRCRSRRYLSD